MLYLPIDAQQEKITVQWKMIPGDSADPGYSEVSAVVVFRLGVSLHTNDDVAVLIMVDDVIQFVDKVLEEHVPLDKILRKLCHCKLYKLNYIDARIIMERVTCYIRTVLN